METFRVGSSDWDLWKGLSKTLSTDLFLVLDEALWVGNTVGRVALGLSPGFMDLCCDLGMFSLLSALLGILALMPMPHRVPFQDGGPCSRIYIRVDHREKVGQKMAPIWALSYSCHFLKKGKFPRVIPLMWDFFLRLMGQNHLSGFFLAWRAGQENWDCSHWPGVIITHPAAELLAPCSLVGGEIGINSPRMCLFPVTIPHKSR